MSQRPLRIAMVAGEPSGDLLASHLIKALSAKRPEAHFFGIGGPKMAAQRFDSWYPMERLSVRGYVEVLRHLPGLLKLRRELRDRLLAEPPDLFIGVDAPDFNLGLERSLKQRGVRTVHFISPSIWAWRRGRIGKIVRAADQMLCLFPFEPALYEGRGIEASYVGHPLADVFPLDSQREASRARLGIEGAAPVVALLPGSRNSELEYMADSFVATARLLAERLPGVRLLVPMVTRETRILFETALYQQGASELPIRLLFGHAHDALAAADVALVASGTATLEAALLKCPLVITYKMSPLSFQIMKRMAYQPWVGLPNVLAGEELAPEILQDAATSEALATALIELYRDGERRARIQRRFTEIHAELRRGTAERAADAILGGLAGVRGSDALAVA
jgi:lipid-A-disaccharide synthase